MSALAALAAALALALAAAAGLTPPNGPALASPDALHGWAAGRGGILGTGDGGATWRLQRAGQAAALEAVDATTAWALAGRALLRTTDGTHWRVAATPGLAELDFVDEDTGFGLGPAATLLTTADGGATWRRLAAPHPLEALCFAGRARGWIARGGTVWRTGNGGASWASSRLLPTRGGFPRPELGCRGAAVWALFHRGVAAGSEGYVVFRSLDAGRTWRAVLAGLDATRPRLPAISAYSGPFAVLGRAAVFAGSCSPCRNARGTTTVVRTTDGGRTWRRTTLALDGFPSAVSFPDPSRGRLLVLAGRAGTVLGTRDGGRTWHTELRSPRLAGP